LREGRVVVGVGNIALWRWGISYWKRLRGLVLEVDDAILTFGVVTSVGRAYAVVVRSTMARVRVRVRREEGCIFEGMGCLEECGDGRDDRDGGCVG
jgi:hypothetical protein